MRLHSVRFLIFPYFVRLYTYWMGFVVGGVLGRVYFGEDGILRMFFFSRNPFLKYTYILIMHRSYFIAQKYPVKSTAYGFFQQEC